MNINCAKSCVGVILNFKNSEFFAFFLPKDWIIMTKLDIFEDWCNKFSPESSFDKSNKCIKRSNYTWVASSCTRKLRSSGHYGAYQTRQKRDWWPNGPLDHSECPSSQYSEFLRKEDLYGAYYRYEVTLFIRLV